MEIPKFTCENCGYCCSVFRSSWHKRYEGPYFNTKRTIMLNEQLLVIYDWEAEDFRKNLENTGSSRKVLPTTALFDMKNNLTIVMHYSIDDGECPFHVNNNCQIYETRPWACRQFPCHHNIAPLIKGQSKRVVFEKNIMCAAEAKDMFFETIKDIPVNSHQLLQERYGEAYDLNLRTSVLAIIKTKFLDELEKKNMIKLARDGYEMKFLLKRIESSKWINFSDFYRKIAGKELLESFDINAIKSNLSQIIG